MVNCVERRAVARPMLAVFCFGDLELVPGSGWVADFLHFIVLDQAFVGRSVFDFARALAVPLLVQTSAVVDLGGDIGRVVDEVGEIASERRNLAAVLLPLVEHAIEFRMLVGREHEWRRRWLNRRHLRLRDKVLLRRVLLRGALYCCGG